MKKIIFIAVLLISVSVRAQNPNKPPVTQSSQFLDNRAFDWLKDAYRSEVIIDSTTAATLATAANQLSIWQAIDSVKAIQSQIASYNIPASVWHSFNDTISYSRVDTLSRKLTPLVDTANYLASVFSGKTSWQGYISIPSGDSIEYCPNSSFTAGTYTIIVGTGGLIPLPKTLVSAYQNIYIKSCAYKADVQSFQFVTWGN